MVQFFQKYFASVDVKNYRYIYGRFSESFFHVNIFYFTKWLPKYATYINGNSISMDFFMNQKTYIRCTLCIYVSI